MELFFLILNGSLAILSCHMVTSDNTPSCLKGWWLFAAFANNLALTLWVLGLLGIA